MLASLQQAFHTVEMTVRNIREKSNLRRLRINVPPTFAKRWLMPRLMSLRAFLPDVDLSITTDLEDNLSERGMLDCAIRFGDANAPAPVALSCSDAQATRGNGRWTSDREWAFEFENDLPPGVRCAVQVKSGFKSPKGAELATGRFAFNTGGPFVQQVRPGTSSRIDEEQYFVLRFNGAATTASLQANVWCAVEGLGERVAIRLIEGKDRTELLKANGWDKAAAQDPLRYATLACNRRFTPDAKVALVVGKGVATPSGVASTVERRLGFQVREALSGNVARALPPSNL